MLKQEKLDTILEIVNTKGTITVKEIINRLDISDMTARRYLQELADKDLLVRVHGGAEKLRSKILSKRGTRAPRDKSNWPCCADVRD